MQERAPFLRESERGVRTESYLASEFCVLTLIGAVQVVLLYTVVKIWCAPAGSFLGQILTLLALMTAGTAVGLLVSALAKTRSTALRLVPLVMIPQITCLPASTRIPASEKFVRMLGGTFVTCFWGTSAAAWKPLLPEETAELLRIAPAGFGWQLGVVLLHAAVYLAAAFVVLRVQVSAQRRM